MDKSNDFDLLANEIKESLNFKTQFARDILLAPGSNITLKEIYNKAVSKCLTDEIKIKKPIKEYIIDDFKAYIDNIAHQLKKLFDQCKNDNQYYTYCELFSEFSDNICATVQEYSFLTEFIHNSKINECGLLYNRVNLQNKPSANVNQFQKLYAFHEVISAMSEIYNELLKYEENIRNNQYDNISINKLKQKLDWHEKTFEMVGEIRNAKSGEFISKCPPQDSETILNKIGEINRLIDTYDFNNAPSKFDKEEMYREIQKYYLYIQNNPLIGRNIPELLENYEIIKEKVLKIRAEHILENSFDEIRSYCERLLDIIQKKVNAYYQLNDDITEVSHKRF